MGKAIWLEMALVRQDLAFLGVANLQMPGSMSGNSALPAFCSLPSGWINRLRRREPWFLRLLGSFHCLHAPSRTEKPSFGDRPEAGSDVLNEPNSPIKRGRSLRRTASRRRLSDQFRFSFRLASVYGGAARPRPGRPDRKSVV